MNSQTFTASVQKDGDSWIALCPELDVASQGDSIEEAKANLREAVELFLEVASPAELDSRLHTDAMQGSTIAGTTITVMVPNADHRHPPHRYRAADHAESSRSIQSSNDEKTRD